MLDGRVAMAQREIDAFFQDLDQIPLHRSGNVPPNNIAPERQWQPGALFPPCSQIEHALHARLRVGQLAFMNDQSRVSCASCNRIENSIEWNDRMFEFAEVKLQGEERTGH